MVSYLVILLFHPGLQPTELDGRFLVSGCVGLDVQDGSSFDHVDSSDFDDVLFSFDNFDYGHPQGIWPVRASCGKYPPQGVVEKRLGMEPEAFGFMEGEKHNEVRESFCVLQPRFEFLEYLKLSLDRIEASGLRVFFGIDVIFSFKGRMDNSDGFEPEEEALILFV